MTITILQCPSLLLSHRTPRSRSITSAHRFRIVVICSIRERERESVCVCVYVCERIEIVSSRWTALYCCCTGSGTGEKDGVSRHRAYIFTAGYSHCRRTKPSPEHQPSHPRINQNSLVPPSSNRHHTPHHTLHLYVTIIVVTIYIQTKVPHTVFRPDSDVICVVIRHYFSYDAYIHNNIVISRYSFCSNTVLLVFVLVENYSKCPQSSNS